MIYPAGIFDVDSTLNQRRRKSVEKRKNISRRSSKKHWNFDSRSNFNINSTSIFNAFLFGVEKTSKKRWKVDVEISTLIQRQNLTVPAGKISFCYLESVRKLWFVKYNSLQMLINLFNRHIYMYFHVPYHVKRIHVTHLPCDSSNYIPFTYSRTASEDVTAKY